ncbi:MAG: hypothetical protein FJ090_15760 [Deltaproteobacteria bacterium]|nr:hypothetical protein [Deltaproteobacteria bacterium]
MPDPSGAALATLITGGLGGGYQLTAEPDLVPAAPTYALRVGMNLHDFRLDLEFVTGASPVRTEEVPFDVVASRTHLDLMHHLVDGYRLDAQVGGGLGWRHLRFLDSTVDGASPQAALGYAVLPVMNPMLVAGGGARYWLWEWVHLRADLLGFVLLGDQPAGHAGPYVDGQLTVGIDFRWEPPPDRDRDGVIDKKDRCPDSDEDFDFYEDNDGCLDPDDDRDGLLDVLDRCKGTAEDVDGFLDDDGCPETNNDNDAYPDALDRCPDEPETENSFRDGDGCPDTLPADVAPLLGQRAELAFDGLRLRPEAEAFLARVQAAAEAHPELIFRFKLYAHTGEGASAAHELTRQRCLAILHWFAARGIDWTRVSYYAGGDLLPAMDGDSPEARAANDRASVELYEAIDGNGQAIPFQPRPVDEW